MHNTSTSVSTAILAGSRKFSAKLEINGNLITVIKSIKLSRGIISGDTISIGGTVSANAEVIIGKVTEELENEEACLYFSIAGADIPMGKFIVTSAVSKGELTTLTMSDVLSAKAEKVYVSNLSYPARTIDVVNEICNMLGISFTGEIENLTINEKPQGYTMREMIGFIACKHGKNAVINRAGYLELKWFENIGYELNKDYINEPELAENDITVNSLKVTLKDNSVLSKGSGSAEISVSNPFMIQTDMDTAFNVVSGFTYKSADITMLLGDPRLDPWDIVELDDIKIPCMNIELEYDGGIKAVVKSMGKGETEQSLDYQGPVTKQMERYYAELVLINQAMINKLDVEQANITYATIASLEATNAVVSGKLNANELEAKVAEVGYLKADTAIATYATITDLSTVNTTVSGRLDAAEADIGTLSARLTNTNTLIFGSATGSTIQTSFSNSVIAQLGDAQIRNAMIDSVSFNKITGIDINTTNLNIHSNDGKSSWRDNTIQISDANGLRVQIGKDAQNDYNLYVWDASGNLMFDALGLTEDGINRQIIDNNSVKNNAGIGFQKIDIDSFFTTVNADNSHTLNSSRIYVDDEAQTLDVSFRSMTTRVNSAVITANTAKNAVDTLEIGGRNLIIIKDLKKAYIDHEDGTEVSSNGYYVSDYITVEGSTDYCLQLWKDNTDRYWHGIYFYDENKEYITNEYISAWSEDKHAVHIITVPDGSAYARISYTKDYEKAKFEKGNKATDYTKAQEDTDRDIESLSETVTSQGTSVSVIQGQISSKIWQQDITTAVAGIDVGGANLYADSKKSTGYVDDANGQLTDNAGYYASDYINVDGETEYCLQLWKSDDSRYWYGAHFYDSNKDYITADYISNYSSDRHVTEKMTTPSDAAYVRISFRTLYERIKLEKGNIATDYSAADEDVHAQYTALSTRSSTLEQDLNGFKATVANTYATISDMGTLSSRVSTAEAKITDEAIINTVSSSLVIGSANLLVSSTAESGYINDADGEVAASSGFYVSDYVTVEGSADYCLQLWKDNTDRYWYGVHFYDSGKNYISNGYISKYSTGKHVTEKFSTPSGAAYARISYGKLYARIKFEKGSVATDYSQADDDVVATSSQTAVTQLKNSISITASTVNKSAGIVISVANEQAATGTIDLSGLVGFSDLSTSGSTTIHGGNVITNTITADKLNVTDLSAIGATIGSWNINSSAIYKDYGDYRVYIQAPSASNTWVYSTQKKTAGGGYNGTYYVRADGYMYCSNAHIGGNSEISGTITTSNITANGGTIGSWNISPSGSLYTDYLKTHAAGSSRYRIYQQGYNTDTDLDTWAYSSQHWSYDSSGDEVSGGIPLWYITYGGDIYTAEGLITCGGKVSCSGSVYPHIYGNGTVLTLGWVDNASNYGIVLQNGCFRPNYDNYYTLGGSSWKWSAVYASTGSIITSDKNEKNTISQLDRDRMKDFVLGLVPSSFKYNINTSDRLHYGFIAQDVEELLQKLDIDSKDFAGFIKSPKTKVVNEITLEEEIIPDEYTYALRYDEFIAPLVAVIQEHEERIRGLASDLLKANAMIECLVNNQKNLII